MLRTVKMFVHRLRTDLRGLFRYPEISRGSGYALDYDEYWRRRRGSLQHRGLSLWQAERAALALSCIEAGSTVLDLGAGEGAMLEHFRAQHQIVPIGADVSDDALAALAAKGIQAIKIDLNDLEALADLPEVDYLTGFEILEHMTNPEAFLNAVRGKVRKGMIFSFPNTGYYAHRLRLLLGRFPLQWIAHPGEHLRFWTVQDVRWWVPQIGFTLAQLIAYQGLPGLKRLFPNLFGQGIFIFIHDKKD